MKKVAYLVLAGILLTCMVFSISSCRKSETEYTKLTVGITNFRPMNYLDENGNWTGFDTEFARLVGQRLGIEVEFQLIEWANKFLELNAGTINVIWNGMTANMVDSVTQRQRYEDVDFTYSYMLNTQAVVIRKDRDAQFKATGDLAGKTAAVEGGSAGASFARRYTAPENLVNMEAQINTFLEVLAGTVDFGMVDIILAEQIVGQGTFVDLKIADIPMPAEVYAIGFRKGSPMVEKVNKIMVDLYNEGKLLELAKKYGLENRLVVDKTRIQDM